MSSKLRKMGDSRKTSPLASRKACSSRKECVPHTPRAESNQALYQSSMSRSSKAQLRLHRLHRRGEQHPRRKLAGGFLGPFLQFHPKGPLISNCNGSVPADNFCGKVAAKRSRAAAAAEQPCVAEGPKMHLLPQAPHAPLSQALDFTAIVQEAPVSFLLVGFTGTRRDPSTRDLSTCRFWAMQVHRARALAIRACQQVQKQLASHASSVAFWKTHRSLVFLVLYP